MRIKIPLPPRSKIGGRKVFEIFYEKSMIKGVISAAGGYGIMSYLMTATPLQIINVCKFSIAENANIIQWHVIAMFAPSFFTGTLIQKFSAERIAKEGVEAMFAEKPICVPTKTYKILVFMLKNFPASILSLFGRKLAPGRYDK